MPVSIQPQMVRFALAHPFTARALARMVQTWHAIAVDHRGIRRVLNLHHRSPDVLPRHDETPQQAHPPPFPTGQPRPLALEPTTHAQRLAQALGPDPRRLRCRTYRAYPTEEQARWRIIARLEVGFRPRRVAKLLDIQPAVVDSWHRRFAAFGLVGLTTRTREGTAVTTRVSVQALMEVFPWLDNHPLLGPYRVKMALDSLGDRYGHTTGWQMVALDQEAHPRPRQEAPLPSPEERPQRATVPHQVWCVDGRYLVQIDGHWRYRMLIVDGYSRAIVGAGGFERQPLSCLLHVVRQALTRWGAPQAVVSDQAAVCTALAPCLRQLGIRWSPIMRGHPWQHLAEGGVSIPRRMLDAYVVGCPERERVYHQHAPFGQGDQCWGHGAHTRRETPGRVY